MGLAKSQEYSALVRGRDAASWRQVGEQHGLAIYQQPESPQKCMAFPIDLCDLDSPDKLQLLNFRKLNHAHLVSIDCVLLASPDLFCAQPSNTILLVDYVPLRLSALTQQLSLSQGLTVANAALAGYGILSFIFGPLYASEEMVCLDDKGKPKVWISYNLAAFQPSLFAINGTHQSTTHSLAASSGFGNIPSLEKEKKCVKQLLDLIEKTIVQGYPPDLKQQIEQICTFRQGEQCIADYCRRNGLQLSQTVSLERTKKPNPTYTAPHSQRESVKAAQYRASQVDNRHSFSKLDKDFQLIEPERIEQTGVSRQPTVPSHSNEHHSGLRSSMNSHSRINIMYNIAPQIAYPQPTYHQPIRFPIMPTYQTQQTRQTQHTQPTQQTQQTVHSNQYQLSVPPSLPQSSSQINRHLSIQDNIQNESSERQDKTVSLQHIQHQVVKSVESQSDLPQSQQDRQSEPQANQFQVVVHQASDNEESEHIQNTSRLYQFDPHQPQHDSNQDIQMEVTESKELEDEEHPIQSVYSPKAIEELRKWEQSLLRLTDKQFYQDCSYEKHRKNESQQEACLSEERDKVFLAQIPIQPFSKEEDLQRYIRTKYSEYFSNEDSGEVTPKSDKMRNIAGQVREKDQRQLESNQQNSFKIPKGKTVSFSSQSKLQQEEDRIKNSNNYRQNIQLSSKQPNYTSSDINRNAYPLHKTKTSGTLMNGIEERYNKYVMNRQPTFRKDLSYASNHSSVRTKGGQEQRSYNYFEGSSQRDKPIWKEGSSREGLSYEQLRRLLKD